MQPRPLPDADTLFSEYFDPWYNDTWRSWKYYPATRPDMLVYKDCKRMSGAQASPLDPEHQSRMAAMILARYEAAAANWPKYFTASSPVDLTWIEAFDQYFDRDRISQVIETSHPKDPNNSYMATCCELGAVLGAVLADHCSTLQWRYIWPFCESDLLHPPTGSVIPVFHWAIKKMSESAVDHGLADKLTACAQMLHEREMET